MTASSFDFVAEILTRQFKIDPQKIAPQTQLQDLGLDSLAMIDFVFHLEDQMDLRIPEERLDPKNAGLTLADVAAALDEGLAQKAKSHGHPVAAPAARGPTTA